MGWVMVVWLWWTRLPSPNPVLACSATVFCNEIETPSLHDATSFSTLTHALHAPHTQAETAKLVP